MPTAGPPATLAVVGVTDISYGGDVLSFTVVFNTTPEFPLNDVTAANPAKWNAIYDAYRFVGASLLLVITTSSTSA